MNELGIKQLRKLLLMAELAYNNTKNASMRYISFVLNYRYHFLVSFKNETYHYLRF